MSRPTRCSLAHAARRGVWWVLLWAVACYGLTGTLQDVVASRHVHRTLDKSFDLMAGWQDFRRIGSGRPARASHDGLARAAHDHVHHERHHHAATDPTVVTLEDGEAGTAEVVPLWSSAGGHAVAPSAGLPTVPLDVGGGAWRVSAGQRWSSVDPRLPERPPRA